MLTGASSGIGRAAARAFAREGAKLVLAARDQEALEDIARQLETDVLPVATDVTDEAQVEALGAHALDRFGRIDAWVNNAAVSAFGTVEQVPMDAFRTIVETNLLGVVHGMRAALGPMRRQGHGTIVNVGSLGGKLVWAEGSAYCASKHAVHAVSAAARQELRGSGIEVCIVAPAAVDTAIYDKAKNYTGRPVGPMPMAIAPERVARAIVRCVRRPRREILVGGVSPLLVAFDTFLPRTFEWFMGRMVERMHAVEERRSAPALRARGTRRIAAKA